MSEQWKKNLYENQDFPDNYTDTTFLYELKRNIHLRKITFRDAFTGAGLLTREICIVVLFIQTFVYLYNDLINPTHALFVCVLCTGIGYVTYYVKYGKRSIPQDVKLVIIYLTFGYFLSPTLKTLTETISTDTIYSTTVIMMLVHLIFFDYDASSANVSRALSFNSALFASLCLASRLGTSFHVFVLLSISLACFALLPTLTLAVGRSNTLLFSFIFINIFGLYFLSIITMFLYIFCVFNLNFTIPMLVVKWQKYKDNIYGPWDEANLTDSNLIEPKTPVKLSLS